MSTISSDASGPELVPVPAPKAAPKRKPRASAPPVDHSPAAQEWIVSARGYADSSQITSADVREFVHFLSDGASADDTLQTRLPCIREKGDSRSYGQYLSDVSGSLLRLYDALLEREGIIAPKNEHRDVGHIWLLDQVQVRADRDGWFKIMQKRPYICFSCKESDPHDMAFRDRVLTAKQAFQDQQPREDEEDRSDSKRQKLESGKEARTSQLEV